MGRPLNKKYMGNRNLGATGTDTSADAGIGGESVASVTLGGTNNSTGFTNGSTSQATFSAPTLANGVTATGTVVTYAAGALTNATTYTTASGTKAAANITSKTVTVKSTSGSGTGATFSITTTGGAASYSLGSNVTVTLVAAGSGYATTNTITIDGADMGGVTSTNDFTFTLATFVATTGTIKSITITNPGSGYATAPTLTLTVGTKGTLTVTPVLTIDTGAVGSSTYRENAIIAYAYINGALREVDLVKQISTKRYKVSYGGTNYTARIRYDAVADGTAGYTAAEGYELNIVALDSAGGSYLVRKLYNRTCTLSPVSISRLSASAGSAITAGQQVKWSFNAATTGVVQIENA